MKRLSMFQTLDELITGIEQHYRELSKNKNVKDMTTIDDVIIDDDAFIEMITTPFEEYHKIVNDEFFMDPPAVKNFSNMLMKKYMCRSEGSDGEKDKYKYKETLKKVCFNLERDLYDYINYTCDYIIYIYNCILFAGKSTEAACVEKGHYIEDPINCCWSKDKELTDKIVNRSEAVIKSMEKLNKQFPVKMKIESRALRLSSLCTGFSFYLFKNTTDVFWYGENIKKFGTTFLLKKLLKADECNFADSDYYVFERFTNVNSAITLAGNLYAEFTTKKAKALLCEENHASYKNEIDKIIDVMAQIIPLYSKNKILDVLMNRIREEVDITGNLTFALRCVKLQLEEIGHFLNRRFKECAYRRFYKFAEMAIDEIEDEETEEILEEFLGDKNIESGKYIIEQIKKYNQENFKRKALLQGWEEERKLMTDNDYEYVFSSLMY